MVGGEGKGEEEEEKKQPWMQQTGMGCTAGNPSTLRINNSVR